MNEKQYKDILKAIRSYTAKNTKTPEAARAALIRTGIYTKTGRLAKKYGGEPKAKSK